MKKMVVLGTVLLLLLSFGVVLVGVSDSISPYVIISSGSTNLAISTPATITNSSNSCCISSWGPVYNLYWVFYITSNTWMYRTCSITACVWSAGTPISSSGTFNSDFWVSGTSVYYVTSRNSASDSRFYFRSGTLTSSGSITWTAPEIAVNTAYPYVRGVGLVTDSNGNVWVSLSEKDPSTGNGHFEVYSYSSVWTRSIDINSNVSTYYMTGRTVPLTGGKLVLLYQSTGPQNVLPRVPPNANAMTCSGIGCNWTSPITTSASVAQTAATNVGDTVAMCSYNGGDALYLTFGYLNRTWSTSTIETGMSTKSGHDCSITSDGKNFGLTYTDEVTGTYATVSGDTGLTWSPLTVIDLGCSQREELPPTFSGTFVGLWYTCYKAPFSLRYAIFSLAQATTTSATNSSTTSASSTTSTTSTISTSSSTFTTSSTTTATSSTMTSTSSTTTSSSTTSTTTTKSTALTVLSATGGASGGSASIISNLTTNSGSKTIHFDVLDITGTTVRTYTVNRGWNPGEIINQTATWITLGTGNYTLKVYVTYSTGIVSNVYLQPFTV